ncbi:MAG: PadR family transcriptional regulator [Thermomicrobiales bacterium]
MHTTQEHDEQQFERHGEWGRGHDHGGHMAHRVHDARIVMRFRGPGGGPDGPGFGPGGQRGGHGPFGGGHGPFGGFGGPGFGRGRRVGRGDVRTAALGLLAEQPLHGYQLIQEITQRSGGTWRPSAGSIYPMLQQLADEGLVRVEEGDGRRVFHLTEAGQTFVAAHQREVADVWESVNDGADDGLRELRDLVGQVAIATMQVAQAGTATQIAAARHALATTRKQLYRILADDEPATETVETTDGSGANDATQG